MKQPWWRWATYGCTDGRCCVAYGNHNIWDQFHACFSVYNQYWCARGRVDRTSTNEKELRFGWTFGPRRRSRPLWSVGDVQTYWSIGPNSHIVSVQTNGLLVLKFWPFTRKSQSIKKKNKCWRVKAESEERAAAQCQINQEVKTDREAAWMRASTCCRFKAETETETIDVFLVYLSLRAARTQGHMSGHTVTACAGWHSVMSRAPVWEQPRNHGRHLWSLRHHLQQQLLPRRPAAVPMVIRDKRVGYMNPGSPAANRKLDWEGLEWNVVTAGWMKGGRRGSDWCYWSFFSDSDEPSLEASSSGGDSS